MSNPIRYDSLLVHYLADELHQRLAGRLCHALPRRAGDHAATLAFERGGGLLFDLHATRGSIRWVESGGAPAADAEVLAVSAPPDERLMRFEMRGGSRFRPQHRTLVAELHTNAWNLLLLDPEERVLFVLRPRSGGARPLRTGELYRPPPPRSRFSPSSESRERLEAEWMASLGALPPAERPAALQRGFAYTGPLNAAAVLGAAAAEADPESLRAAFSRWWRLASLPAAEPALLDTPRGPQPYPLPLPGIDSRPAESLLAAMELAAAAQAAPEPRPAEETRWVATAERRLEAAERRARRLRESLEAAGGAERARHFGDLLLAHLAQVSRGGESVRLGDWDGTEIEIPLDPTLSPVENANRWYDEARRQSRAEAALPELIREAEAEAARWREVVAEVRDGRVDERVLDLLRAPPAGNAAEAGGQRLPYREYRTSGGLEVRVGRGSGDNDRLTFTHSQPNDVWLHARSVPGSHVILRWSNPEQAPPARDLEEAAALAAWYSKARTSGVVAVDWTRRKHVRKPRGAGAGKVIPQRVKTIFVQPDAALEKRLASLADPLQPAEATTSGNA